jgi:hypothetical protein
VALSVLLFGIPVVADIGTVKVGSDTDPGFQMWALRWWPYAMSHGLDPFYSNIVWATTGINIAWTTSIPGLSLVAMPLTLTAGPVVAYNVLALLAPALAAWVTYLLCRRLGGRVLPSLVAGYVFGYSSYVIGHLRGHLNLSMVVFIPLAVYVVVLYLQRAIRARTMVLLLTGTLVFQFLTSTEVFLTLTFFAITAAVVIWFLVPKPRDRVLTVGKLILASYVLTGLLMSPYLLAAFRDLPEGSINPPIIYSTDVLNLFVPSESTLVGGDAARTIEAKFTGDTVEHTGYVGLPLIALVLLFSRQEGSRRIKRFLLLMLGIVIVASLGNRVHLGGITPVRLPWAAFVRLPLLDNALPARFMVYAFLVLAVISSRWLSAAADGRRRWILGGLVIISLLPNVARPFWHTDVGTPRFFAEDVYRRHLEAGETVLILPYGKNGDSMLWQAQTDMYFRMAGGHLGPIPPEFDGRPVVRALFGLEPLRPLANDFQGFLRMHDVRHIIIGPTGRDAWVPELRALGFTGRRIADVVLIEV